MIMMISVTNGDYDNYDVVVKENNANNKSDSSDDTSNTSTKLIDNDDNDDDDDDDNDNDNEMKISNLLIAGMIVTTIQ
ncbi:unnamed protein product [Cercopithifilaria johnstoni]|uniref:Uncharacterized protein n=1 Tax=Cercopithifilaria johnstoni TaxID=2874296 RepID=A0A8J2MKE0_9BILA|nr:unnamed protein product [Cercopithifilaria johnstoni]